HVLQEDAVLDLGVADLQHQPLEVEAADQDADQRHDDVGDRRGDDLAERRADDHADGEVDDVALHRELAELLQHGPALFDHKYLTSSISIFSSPAGLRSVTVSP